MIKSAKWKTEPVLMGIKDNKIKWVKIKGAANSDAFLLQAQIFRHDFGYGMSDNDQYILAARIFA